MSLPTIAVGAVVVDAGRILLVRRGQPPAEGLWAVPGGRVEPTETIRGAVAREVQEETGLSVDPGSLAWWGRIPSDGGAFLVFDFHATLRGGELSAASDAAEARWVPLEDVLSLPIVPSMRELMEAVR